MDVWWWRLEGGGRRKGIVETKMILHEVCCEDVENVVVRACGRGGWNRRGGRKHCTITPVTGKGGLGKDVRWMKG